MSVRKHTKKKVLLIIMDGWGIGKPDKFNAILNAKTPHLDKLEKEYPNVRLNASGGYIGLPEGELGTSEINHKIIGSGRVLLQDLPRVNKSIEDQTIYSNEAFVATIDHAVTNQSNLHFIGLISDGNIHASIEHLFALLSSPNISKVQNVYLHLFSDGRDTPPKSVEKYMTMVDEKINGTNIKVASLQGRFYLDRDRDWARTDQAVDLITQGKGMHVTNWRAAMDFSYNQNVTDEFFTQFIVEKEGTVGQNDSVIFFHYRTDRMYQIVKALLDKKLENLYVVSLTKYSDEFEFPVMFKPHNITHTLAETISENKLKQLHITETEKYAHLTYFFNGDREKELPFEDWKMIMSNRFVKPNYNLEPSMRAFEIADEVIKKIQSNEYDFITVNFPNTDMVGHCGNYEASVIASEAVDYCIGKIYEQVKSQIGEWAMMITADHGNSEEMWDYVANQPHTQHTTNPVPFIMVSDLNCKLARRESLEDIAPTILELMHIEKPDVMTGISLIEY